MRKVRPQLWLAVWLIAIGPLPLYAASGAASDRCPPPDSAEGIGCRESAVRALLQAWVVAWANADVENYLDLYDETPTEGPDRFRASRDELRRQRLLAQKDVVITLELESMAIDEDGAMDVVFVQRYRSSSVSSELRKQLFLGWQNGSLKIRREVVLD
jgi:hypothetical protein